MKKTKPGRDFKFKSGTPGYLHLRYCVKRKEILKDIAKARNMPLSDLIIGQLEALITDYNSEKDHFDC